MMRTLLVALAAVVFTLAATPSQACTFPSSSFIMHHSNLIDVTETIVIARAIGATADDVARFETLEVLHGNPPPTFTVKNGSILGSANQEPEDFDQHRNSVFWDKFVTRSWITSDCIVYPVFHIGRDYLIFLDFAHARAYEEITSPDDLWLQVVREQLADPNDRTQTTIELPDWIRRTKGAFLGQIQSCAGPILRVDEVLHGSFSRLWFFDDPKGPDYWDGQWPHDCKVGDRYFIVSYVDDPDAWPITYPRYHPTNEPEFVPHQAASVFPVLNRQLDLRAAIYHSEFNVIGPQVMSVKLLRSMMSK